MGKIDMTEGIIAMMILEFFSLDSFWYRSSLKAKLMNNEELLLEEKADRKN